MFQIIKNAELPASKHGLTKYPFADMKVGDGFDEPRDMGKGANGADGRQSSIGACANSWRKRHNPAAQFTVRVVDENTTLAQFETIDGLLSAFLNRPEPDWASRASVTDWMRHEWRLYDACVDVLGLAAVQSFSSAADCAVDFVTRCMTSASLVEA